MRIDAMKFLSLLHTSNVFIIFEARQVLHICNLVGKKKKKNQTENETYRTQNLPSSVCREIPGISSTKLGATRPTLIFSNKHVLSSSSQAFMSIWVQPPHRAQLPEHPGGSCWTRPAHAGHKPTPSPSLWPQQFECLLYLKFTNRENQCPTVVKYGNY